MNEAEIIINTYIIGALVTIFFIIFSSRKYLSKNRMDNSLPNDNNLELKDDHPTKILKRNIEDISESEKNLILIAKRLHAEDIRYAKENQLYWDAIDASWEEQSIEVQRHYLIMAYIVEGDKHV